MQGYIIYGLSNCDTTKKTIQWFKKHQLNFQFHNYKATPISKEKLADWCYQKGWDKLLNKRGTAFQRLHPVIKLSATTEANVIEIMFARPSTIKRPIIEKNNQIITIGYNEIEFNVRYL
jgi:arsenate reductase